MRGSREPGRGTRRAGLFVLEVAYPPGCPTPNIASAEQRAAGEVCSEMQRRFHGIDERGLRAGVGARMVRTG